MNTAKVYQDSDGNDCSIWQMVRIEPEWAANRIQEGEKAVVKLQECSWRRFDKVKPEDQQICIVAAGPDKHTQILAVRWCQSDEEFYWYDPDLGLDPYPTEATTHWMPFPYDPE